MPIIVGVIALLAGIAGVGFVVKGVSEVTEDIKPAIPVLGIAVGLVAVVMLMREAKS